MSLGVQLQPESLPSQSSPLLLIRVHEVSPVSLVGAVCVCVFLGRSCAGLGEVPTWHQFLCPRSLTSPALCHSHTSWTWDFSVRPKLSSANTYCYYQKKGESIHFLSITPFGRESLTILAEPSLFSSGTLASPDYPERSGSCVCTCDLMLLS